MTFEERFPSLKDKRIICQELLDADCIDTEQVEKHCLDKQRVKELLESRGILDRYDEDIKKEILEELGLE